MRLIFEIIKNYWFEWLIVLIPSSLFLAPLPSVPNLYYILLIFLAFLAFFKRESVSRSGLLFLLFCALSIILGNPAPLFKPWERFALFALLLMAYFPIFESEYFERIRSISFWFLLIILVFTSVGSFIGYFMGINYMARAFKGFSQLNTIDTAGWFGGLTYQSMILGPICAIALTVLFWILLEITETVRIKWIIGILIFCTFCCMMLTASRGANIAGIGGVLTIIFIKYKNQFGKFIQTFFLVAILSIVLSPVYMPYADKVLTKQRENIQSGSTFSSRKNQWEHRYEEFLEYPILGYGFAAINTKNIGEYMPSSGIVEPGSSWLTLLSMTGLLGTLTFLSMFLSTFYKLYQIYQDNNRVLALLHIAILAIFAVHFISEGYIFSAGGALCFLFWFFFGCAYSYARDPFEYIRIEDREDSEPSVLQ